MYDLLLKGFKMGELTKMSVYSQPFVSALLADCMKKGIDVNEGGADIFNLQGISITRFMPTLPIRLTAIDKLVYKKAKITVDEILEACAKILKEKGGASAGNARCCPEIRQ